MQKNVIQIGFDLNYISLSIDWIVLKFGTLIEYGHYTMCTTIQSFSRIRVRFR